MAETYPRDLIGYGRTPPHANWPGQARLALQIVLNYEEGGERSILHGDDESECYLQEVVGIPSLKGVRDIEVESVYEYGSNATESRSPFMPWRWRSNAIRKRRPL
jgi:hypothetical protein